ncbi:acyl carrier protein [Streptomyces sp. NPDC101733]|uniref:acyl carrier protein n=1 Tax=unclassified Streptomyces TaxID=2593676 RepID=UPI0037FBA84B
MSSPESTAERLRNLPETELFEEIEQIVLGIFRTSLIMDETEELPLDLSYFDLGLTSLGLTSIRKQLENLLDVPINANVLFNTPTIAELVDHLVAGLSRPSAVASAEH